MAWPIPKPDVIRQVRKGMYSKGFCIVDAPITLQNWSVIDFDFGARLAYHVRFDESDVSLTSSRMGSFTKRFVGVPRSRVKFLYDYARWMLKILKSALPEEGLYIDDMWLRKEVVSERSPSVDKPHLDYTFIRALTVFYGETTLFANGDGKMEPIPLLKTIFYSGIPRSQEYALNNKWIKAGLKRSVYSKWPKTGILHQRPIPTQDRLLCVSSFARSGKVICQG